MKTVHRISAVALALVLAGVAPALAHSGHDRTEQGAMNAMLEEAQLVFLGEVAEVDYRVELSEAKERIPVTYVTYKIGKVIRGRPADEALTMRFLGGPDGRGRFLTLSNTPRFMPGEQDLLLVRGNGSKGCPLVHCEDGRFRVHRGGVYNAHGVPVRALVKEGPIARGDTHEAFMEFRYPRPRFDELMKNPEAAAMLEKSRMTVEEARRIYEQEAPREILVRSVIVRGDREAKAERKADQGDDRGAIPETEEPLQEGPIAIEELMERMAELSRQVGGDPRPVSSIDPRRAPTLTAALEMRPAEDPDRDHSAEDEEARRVQENGGNPVVKQ